MFAKMPEDRTTYTAPVGSVDLAAFEPDGSSYVIWPCTDCLPFHAEVHVDWVGIPFVCEWHAIDCPQFKAMTTAPRAEP